MWKNYLLVAVRNLSRNRLYSAINIVGLAIGLAGCLLIAGYVTNELSFEHCHANRDRIYRAAVVYECGHTTIPWARMAPPFAPAVAEECPEVEAAARFRLSRDVAITVGREQFSGNSVAFASPELLKVFTLPLERGDGEVALTEPASVLLSKELAHKCFGDDNPIGQTIKIDQTECTVRGVLKHIPANTQLRFDAIASYTTLERMGENTTNWTIMGSDYVYLLLKQDAQASDIQGKIAALVARHTAPGDAKYEFRLQPLNRIYMNSHFNGELSPVGNLTYVYLFSSIAIVLLVLASINFVNLATARTSRRIKEVAVRKVFGAYRTDLISQFIGESVCLTAVAMLLGIALFEIAKPQLETFVGRELPIGLLSSPFLFLAMIIMIVLVGIVAGSYPAFYMSRYRPADAMRKDSSRTTSRSGLRRALVVIQFSTAIGLTITSIAIYRQTNLFRIKDLGYQHDNMLILNLNDDKMASKCTLLRDEIAKTHRVDGVSALWGAPGSGWLALQTFSNPSRPDLQPTMTPLMWVDENFITTFGITLLAGRSFSNQTASDQVDAVIINEAAAKEFGLTNPVGQTLIAVDSKQPCTVIGLVKDFHFGSLRDQIGSLILSMEPSRYVNVAVKLPKDDVGGAVAAITDVWKRVLPDHPFKYEYLDDMIAGNYTAEQRTGSLFVVFSILAAFIGSLGMFGLASFAAERRTKEVGIRKVLGASVTSVVRMLMREFVILVAISNVVAWPVAYYAVRRWLQGFAYRIDLCPDMFIYAGLVALVIALATVGYQAIRAATANPVTSLKYE